MACFLSYKRPYCQQNGLNKSKTDLGPEGNPAEHHTTRTGVLILPDLVPQIVDGFQDS